MKVRPNGYGNVYTPSRLPFFTINECLESNNTNLSKTIIKQGHTVFILFGKKFIVRNIFIRNEFDELDTSAQLSRNVT